MSEFPDKETLLAEYRRTSAALDATCKSQETMKAAVVACVDAIGLYFRFETGSGDDAEYVDGQLSAALGMCEEALRGNK